MAGLTHQKKVKTVRRIVQFNRNVCFKQKTQLQNQKKSKIEQQSVHNADDTFCYL